MTTQEQTNTENNNKVLVNQDELIKPASAFKDHNCKRCGDFTIILVNGLCFKCNKEGRE